MRSTLPASFLTALPSGNKICTAGASPSLRGGSTNSALQLSKYPAVVIPVLTQHYAMLQRSLLYTGVTRGKRLVVLVGQKKAIAIAVRNVSGRRRWSKLNEWLAAPAGRQNNAS